ncbi:Arrestin domain-containing protein 3 [Orchesella cincta]|uniref:Arrestin domain-containing protein 3 n=1 Tax=Orchesella cincta TaxID=48709 RepID=A0A1D2MAY4_ORCCI|nr:Arrestin domain-containing protein 3 [Orchesella cincta]
MGVQIFLNFDNPSATFQPGNVITGNVLLSTTNQVVVKGLAVTFHGEGNVHWTESTTVRLPRQNSQNFESPHHGDHLHPYHGHHHHNHDSAHHQHDESTVPVTRIKEFKNQETYLNGFIGIPICGQESGSTIELPAGFSQQIPFSYQLPLNLPTSCQLTSGSVKYFAEASITMKTSLLILSFDTSKSSIKTFDVRGLHDLTQVNGALLPVELQKGKQFGFLCCASGGEFMLELRLARTGFVAGESIMFHLNYSNSTNVTFEKLKAKLMQNIVYITFGKKKEEMKEMGEKLYPVVITQGTNGEWKDQLQIPPPALLTDLGGCRIMQIRYTLVKEIFFVHRYRDTLPGIEVPKLRFHLPLGQCLEAATIMYRISVL